MKKYTLKAQTRDIVGRKVKQLRRQGLLPATVYGKKVTSVSVAVKTDEFEKTYQAAGETGLVDLVLDKNIRPVLIHHVQNEPVTGEPLHIEFFQVDLKEAVRTNVPLVFIGEAPAVAQKQGVLLTVLDEVEVEALPTQLPEKITVDVSLLAQVNQELKVSDLKLPSGVTLLTGVDLTVVKIGALVSKEAEAEAAAETAVAAAAEAAQAAAPAPAAAEGGEPAVQPTAAEPVLPETKPQEKKAESK